MLAFVGLLAGLQEVRYMLVDWARWCSKDTQSFASACQLPDLKSISLLSTKNWQPDDKNSFEEIKAKARAMVTVEENMNLDAMDWLLMDNGFW